LIGDVAAAVYFSSIPIAETKTFVNIVVDDGVLETGDGEGGFKGGPLCQARAGLQQPTTPAEQPTVSRGQQRAG
tara:strand:+ start:150 stop:371 length:222 start_codon:yes stop_codon:yes gene_type:complete